MNDAGNSHINSLSLSGLRGFSQKETLKTGIPTGKPGSGMTVLIGNNGCGKTTALEAFLFFTPTSGDIHIDKSARNRLASNRVEFTLSTKNGSLTKGTASSLNIVSTISSTGNPDFFSYYYIPSRRRIERINSQQEKITRKTYTAQMVFNQDRQYHGSRIHQRLLQWQANKELIDPIFKEMLGDSIDWMIDQIHQGGPMAFQFLTRNSDFLPEFSGDGMHSALFLIDALYDSEEGDVILIDEPEVSLNPHNCRSVLSVLKKYSTNRQIIISTHSQYFIDDEMLENGAVINRFYADGEAFKIASANTETTRGFATMSRSWKNPHFFGNDAKEVLFVNDRVIVTEGQEDVTLLKRFVKEHSVSVKGFFYGWGSSGNGNVNKVAKLLHELGFKRVALLYDNCGDIEKIKSECPNKNYHQIVIPTDDIRDKKKYRQEKAGHFSEYDVLGLFDENGSAKKEHVEYLKETLKEINKYVTGSLAFDLYSSYFTSTSDSSKSSSTVSNFYSSVWGKNKNKKKK